MQRQSTGIAPAELDYSAAPGRAVAADVRRLLAPGVRRVPAAQRPRRRRAGAGKRQRPAQRPAAAGGRRVRTIRARMRIARNGATVTPFPRAAAPRRPRQPSGIDEDRKIVGFGDDLPAFLARPPRIVARP